MNFNIALVGLLGLIITTSAYADNEWTFIGKSTNGTSVYATQADVMPDGSYRTFLRGELQAERKPEGIFAIFKSPEKYTEHVAPFAILINCKKNSVRDFKAGPLGSEFHIPWQPATPGSFGAVAYKAFCKK